MKWLILLIYFVCSMDVKKLNLGLVLAGLDGTVLSKMKYPADDGGENLLEGIVLYNRSFVHLIRLMKGKKDTSIKKIVLRIYEQGGPLILQYNLDKDLIKKKFSWNNEDYIHLTNRLTETNVLWKEFLKIYSKDSDWFIGIK